MTEEILNYKTLEKEWYEDRVRYSEKELLEIFPEAKDYLREKSKNNLDKIAWLEFQIRDSLTNIKKKPFGYFTDWFRREIIKVFLGETYENLLKETKKIAWLLRPPEEQKKQVIPAWEIERAKNVPFTELLDISKGDFAICPFHSEKTPSLYCKNNFYHCFACGETGDTIKFVMKTRNLSFKEAVRFLN